MTYIKVIHTGTLTMDSERLHRTILHIVELLVEGRYGDLASLSERNHLKPTDLLRVVEDYGCRLVTPPLDSLEELNVISIENSLPAQWYVGVNLWTVEEGPSDLTLELTLRDSSGDLYEVELNDLHVL